ncbi:MAG TPA: F0F1 ATP synthase subunit A [Blastocatellia bacterium]|nr:F0F1 ATP synthase subunit A [Blastocatellia bacterium]
MFLSYLLQEGGEATKAAAEHAEKAGAEVPWLVEQVNHLLGPLAFDIEKSIMPPIYHAVKIFGAEWPGARFTDGHDALAHGYLPIPTHVVMATIAFLVCTVGLYLFRGKLSVDKPSSRQHVLELIVLQVREMLTQIVGPFGPRYLAVIASFTLFILISNLMGLLPGLTAPTVSINVTLALGITSFLYYIGMGFKQQGPKYLMHFFGGLTGILLIGIGPIIFVVELVSNFVRPATLGIRLFVNIFADEKIAEAFANILPIGLPIATMALGTFVAIVQAFIFITLSMVYLSETVPHEEHDHEHGAAEHGEVAHAAAH